MPCDVSPAPRERRARAHAAAPRPAHRPPTPTPAPPRTPPPASTDDDAAAALAHAPAEVHDLLKTRISQLGLKLEGSPVERCVEQLYRELARKGIHRFRPICYLSDEWGCPSGEPVIGVPFYLADRRLERLERALNDLEDEREIMAYLRHEAGHAL